MTSEQDHLRAQVIAVVSWVQEMPYVWPVPHDAKSARDTNSGSCASKHALLAEELDALGIPSVPLLIVGPLVPLALMDDPEFEPGARLPEVHECLTIITPWAGPLRVDVTWDPALAAHGLPASVDWKGSGDMNIAVGEGGPCWSVPREKLRTAKEALRTRLYRPGERQVRDAILQKLAARFSEWRAQS